MVFDDLIIRARSLSKSYGEEVVLTDFNLDVWKGSIFGILGVSVGLKWNKIQEKFKKLVKKLHPDMNAGNKKFEDKLKIITLAYTQLKNTYREKNEA